MGLDAFAEVIASRLLALGAQALVLAALVWALCRFLPRLDARTRAWLWWLVACQMVLGLVWHAPVGVPLLPAEPAAPVVASVVRETAMLDASADVSFLPAGQASFAGAGDEHIGWKVWLLVAWLAGVVVVAANTLRQWWCLRGQLARSRACTDPRVRGEYLALGQHLGITRLPALRISDEVDSPMLARPWNPVLVLPAAGLVRMRGDDLRMALHHELAHLQRHDLWWACMPALAQHLFFFHPVAHLAAREYALAREVACDAAVLADERHTAHDYGRLLVKLGVATASSPALAGASPTFRILKRRLLMLQHTASPLRIGALAATVGLVLLGVVPYRVTASVPAAPPAPMPVAAVKPPAAPPVPTPPPKVRPAEAPPAPATPPRATPAAAPTPPSAPPSPPAPPRPSVSATRVINIDSERRGEAYVLIDGDEVTMVGRSDDVATARKLQQGGAPLLWVRKDGKQYVVRDIAVVQRFKQAHAPVGKLGAQQGKLGEQQAALGARQGALGARQGELGARMAAIGAEQAAVAMSGGQDHRADLEKRMEALAKEQEALARQQEVLARQQEPLSREQEGLSRRQQAAIAQMRREVDRLLEESIRSGKAQTL